MKKDTRVTIQCPSFRRGKKFEGIITGEKTLAALHIAKHGRTYFVKLDGNNKSTQFHESWLAELPAPSTPVKETEQFFNGDLQMDAEKHLRTDNFEIKKDEAENDGELMYYLDVNDDSYFYHNESDRDFDYARAKRLFTKSPTPTSKEGLEDRGFTPGEWEASYNSEEFPGQAAIYGCDGDTNGRVIAVLDTSDQTDMANIDLICAAPIMYDLLKWVVNEIETTPDELSDALLGMIKIKCNQLFTRINKD